MTLSDEIGLWDGKTVAIIDDIFNRYRDQPTFLDELVNGLADPQLQRGGSWLLKKALEEKQALSSAQVEQIYMVLDQLDHWETKLHILQSMDKLPIPSEQAATVEAFLQRCLNDKKKFVKAWAYNGYHLLGRQHPIYQTEADALLQKGLLEESASVKARIRNILKER